MAPHGLLGGACWGAIHGSLGHVFVILAALMGQTQDAPLGNRALITVRVRPNTEVWIDGNSMGAKDAVRRFTTAPLSPGKTYRYRIRAVSPDGNTRSAVVTFQAGDEVTVDLGYD